MSLAIRVVTLLFIGAPACLGDVLQRRCASVPNAKGYTWPSGDILVERDIAPLDLDCVVTDPHVIEKYGGNVGMHLDFFNGNQSLNKSVVARNATSIHLRLEPDELPDNSPLFVCMLDNTDHICGNVILVGSAPQQIPDFRCISLNNDRLVCNFTRPNLGVSTSYLLSYFYVKLDTIIGKCPNLTQHDNVYTCEWSLYTNPPYRQAIKEFNFNLTAINAFGRYTQLLHFDHYANILPNKPEELSVIGKTTSSLLLRWKIPATIRHHHLQYRVMYQCKFKMDDFRVAVVKTIVDTATVRYNLTDLPYANDLCFVRVALRVNATRAESMWSEPAKCSNFTAEAAPSDGPRVTLGSFKLINDTAVRVYWHKVPAEYENGENLRYHIKIVSGRDDSDVRIANVKANSAVIANLDSEQRYMFALWAYNEVGIQTTDYAYVAIPARAERPHQVREFKKIDHTNGAFTLEWQPRNALILTNYTIFWCKDTTRSHTEDCNGDWNWVIVPPDVKTYKYQDPHYNSSVNAFYKVGISGNSETGSSGMVFTTCEQYGDQIPAVNLDKPTEYDATSVKITWSTACSSKNVESYVVEYCKVEKKLANGCQGEMTLTKEVAGYANHFIIDNLMPYSTYVFTIYPVMENGARGVTSDPESVVTKEAAPTPPRNLIVKRVTGTTITLRWMEPEQLNGKIIYDLYVDETMIPTNDNKTEYTLEKLQSFKNYTMYVKACTSKCSDISNIVRATTLMDKPSRVQPLVVMFRNGTNIQIAWEPPAIKAGPIMYEVRVKDAGPENITRQAADSFDYKCESPTITVSVRAYNLNAATNQTFYGEWSERLVDSCAAGISLLVPMLVLLCVFLLACVFGGRHLHTHCRRMRDVSVKLPPGLTTDWQVAKDPMEHEPKISAAADEQMLLEPRGETPPKTSPYIADSSGCSSAHGSVTSDSDATISAASDSGTEQSELRKRSNSRWSSKTALLDKSDVKASPAESYSRVGIETNPLADHDDGSAGYTRMPAPAAFSDLPVPEAVPMDLTPKVGAYVTCAQAMSIPATTKPKEEVVSKGYVMVSEAMKSPAEQKRDTMIVDSSKPSYVTVGQMPICGVKVGKPYLYDTKLIKED